MVNLLKRLHVIEIVTEQMITINKSFRDNMISVISGRADKRSFGEWDKNSVDRDMLAKLNEFSVIKWESILHFMVGNHDSHSSSSDSRRSTVAPVAKMAVQVLTKAGLMAKQSPADPQLSITNSGFQFLLQDIHSQLWTLLLKYVDLSEDGGRDPVEVLNFLFVLGALEYGRCYSSNHMSPVQKHILTDLADFGILYLGKRCFYTTKFTVALGTNCMIESAAHKDDSFIVIETNYRLYAYTDSPLQISVIGLFTQLTCRFPDMVVGIINRESVRRALLNGITAHQIISYLQGHAHPLLKQKRGSIVPATIIDQITLWELERNRLSTSEGYLYTTFSGEDEFRAISEYAKQLDVLVWESEDVPKKMMLFISAEGHEAVKSYAKNLIAIRSQQ